MAWTLKIKEKALEEVIVSLALKLEETFHERYHRQRNMELRLAEVLAESDIEEIIIGRVARNASNQHVKY